MSTFEYKDNKNTEYEQKIDALLKGLPLFVTTYERGIEGFTAPYTRLIYLRRIDTFFRFLYEHNPVIASKGIDELDYEDIEQLEAEDIEEFTHWLRTGTAANNTDKTKESSINNYLSALSSLWNYMVSHGKVKHNVIKDVRRGKKSRHEVIRLDRDNKAGFLDAVRLGNGQSRHAASYRTDVSVARDDAICSLMIKTGLRVSEVVGINVGDINFDRNYVHVLRKENKPDDVFFSDEVKESLLNYLELRPLLHPLDTEDALFLSSIGAHRGERLTVRSVQRMVKKYAMAGAPEVGGRITPHKLRSTYATDMILKTGDLSLVQAEMNHESPATTALYIDKRAHQMEAHRNDLDSE